MNTTHREIDEALRGVVDRKVGNFRISRVGPARPSSEDHEDAAVLVEVTVDDGNDPTAPWPAEVSAGVRAEVTAVAGTGDVVATLRPEHPDYGSPDDGEIPAA